jgi:hypothetical protein
VGDFVQPGGGHATNASRTSVGALLCIVVAKGAGLSSELIVAAMQLTEALWPPEEMAVYPRDGWITWTKPAEIASPNPGYCFKQAGWRVDHEWAPKRGRRGRIRLRAELLEGHRS